MPHVTFSIFNPAPTYFIITHMYPSNLRSLVSCSVFLSGPEEFRSTTSFGKVRVKETFSNKRNGDRNSRFSLTVPADLIFDIDGQRLNLQSYPVLGGVMYLKFTTNFQTTAPGFKAIVEKYQITGKK